MNESTVKVMAAMETGNTCVARLVYRELLEVNGTEAKALYDDVLATYNYKLI
jgi:hypothetical protein